MATYNTYDNGRKKTYITYADYVKLIASKSSYSKANGRHTAALSVLGEKAKGIFSSRYDARMLCLPLFDDNASVASEDLAYEWADLFYARAKTVCEYWESLIDVTDKAISDAVAKVDTTDKHYDYNGPNSDQDYGYVDRSYKHVSDAVSADIDRILRLQDQRRNLLQQYINEFDDLFYWRLERVNDTVEV